jgi:acyl carrier protein
MALLDVLMGNQSNASPALMAIDANWAKFSKLLGHTLPVLAQAMPKEEEEEDEDFVMIESEEDEDLVVVPQALARAIGPTSALLQKLANTPVSTRVDAVRKHIRADVVRILVLDNKKKNFAGAASLLDLGLDLLMAVELRSVLVEAVKKPIPATVAFDYGTLNTLADYVLSMCNVPTAAPVAVARAPATKAPVAKARGAAPAPRKAAVGATAVLTTLANTAVTARLGAVEKYIRKGLIKILALDSKKKNFAVSASLLDLGLDSNMAVELRSALGAAVKKPLPATMAFDYGTLRQMSTYILSLCDVPDMVPEPVVEAAAPAVVNAAVQRAPSTPSQTPAATPRKGGLSSQKRLAPGSKRKMLTPAKSSSKPAQASATPAPLLLMADLSDRHEVAVIGMSCRFPGGANTIDDFWKLLEEGRSGIIKVPKARFDVDAVYDADSDKPGKMNTKFGGFLDQGIDKFDPLFFGISPRHGSPAAPSHGGMLDGSGERREPA